MTPLRPEETAEIPPPSTELFVISIGVQGWLLTLDEGPRMHAIDVLRRLADRQVEDMPQALPLWPRELRLVVTRQVREATTWWGRLLDEAES